MTLNRLYAPIRTFGFQTLFLELFVWKSVKMDYQQHKSSDVRFVWTVWGWLHYTSML